MNDNKVNTVMEGISIFIKIAEATDKLETMKKNIIGDHNTLVDRATDLSKRNDMTKASNAMEELEDKMDKQLKNIDDALEKWFKQGNELSKKMEVIIDNLSSDEKDLVVSELNKKIEYAEQEHYLASETKEMGYLTEQQEKERDEEINRYEISIDAYKYFKDLLGPITYETVKPGSR